MADNGFEISIRDSNLGEVGFLAVHNLIRDRAFGGVRVVPNIDRRELRAAARTMAHKAAFLGVPVGGAKAAVRLDSADPIERDHRLRAFGAGIGALLRAGIYLPAIDLNCEPRDIALVQEAAGLASTVGSWLNLGATYTAKSCHIATLAALAHRGLQAEGASYAIQGFGRVGRAYARFMSASGARLVAVSNHLGALAHPDGLDVDDLIAHHSSRAEPFILDYAKAEPVSHEAVICAHTEVLLPAARAFAVDAVNRDNVHAHIVVCAANAAVDPDTERSLFETGKLVVSDFVANCGGVLESALAQEGAADAVGDVLEISFRQAVTGLLERARCERRPFGEVARDEANSRLQLLGVGPRNRLGRLGQRLRRRAPRGMRVRWRRRFYERLWSER